MNNHDAPQPGTILWGVFSPNAPNLIDPDLLGLGGRETLDQLRALNVESRWRPDVILAISPHWTSRSTFLVDDSAAPRFIEDYTGFPPQLYGHTYRPPGDPALAALLVAEGKRSDLAVAANRDWGLDHGIWTVLRPLAPSARIPVVPLSITDEPPSTHIRWGQAIARAVARSGKNAVVVATGLILHNFSHFSFRPDAPGWKEGGEIEREILDLLLRGDVQALARFDRPKWREAAPEGDLAPYFVLAGALGTTFRPRLISNERVFGSAGMSLVEFTPADPGSLPPPPNLSIPG